MAVISLAQKNSGPLRRDVRCGVFDGCRHSSLIYISHRRRAVYYEVPKAASCSVKRTLGIRLTEHLHEFRADVKTIEIDDDSWRGLQSELGEERVRTLIQVLASEAHHHWRSSGDSAAPLKQLSSEVEAFARAYLTERNEIRRGAADGAESAFAPFGIGEAGFQMFFGDPLEAAKRYASYFKFAVVRSPWDRLVSNWTMFCRSGIELRRKQIEALFQRPTESISFEDFVEGVAKLDNHHWENCATFVPTENGRLLLDYVARLETLADDWEQIKSRIGVGGALPIRNVTEHSAYRDYYNDRTRTLAAQLYRDDVELFGYQY